MSSPSSSSVAAETFSPERPKRVSEKKAKPLSKYKGVFCCGKKFKAQIQTNGVQHYLGLFDCEIDAAKAYDNHARVVLGLKAKTNFEYASDQPPNPDIVPPPPPPKAEPTLDGATGKPTAHARRVYVGVKVQPKRSLTSIASSGIIGDPTTLSLKRRMTDQDARRIRGEIFNGYQQPTSGAHYTSSSRSSSSAVPGLLPLGVAPLGMSAAGLELGFPSMGLGLGLDMTGGITGDTAGAIVGANMLSQLSEVGFGDPNNHAQMQELHQLQQLQQQFHFQQQQQQQFQYQRQLEASAAAAGGGAIIAGGEIEGDGESEPDWREQIYYWTGELSFDAVNCVLVWKGTWLGSFTGRPTREELDWSNNEFEYTSDRVSQWEIFEGGMLRPKSGYFRGYYMMDNEGSGALDKYLDNQYYVEFEEVRGLTPPRYTVIGKGESDFGTFILTGTYNAGNRVLEMARQYITETDERCAMDISQLKQFLASAAAAAML